MNSKDLLDYIKGDLIYLLENDMLTTKQLSRYFDKLSIKQDLELEVKGK